MTPVTQYVFDGTKWQNEVTVERIPARATAQSQAFTMGASAAGNAEFDRLNGVVGPMRSRRTYDSAIPASFSASRAAVDVAAGRVSYWSYKPDVKTFPTDLAAQQRLRTFLGTVPSGHRLTVTPWHEPEDNINAGSFTLAQQKSLVNKVGEVVKSMNRPELRTAFCLMGPWTFDTRSAYFKWDWNNGWNWNVIDAVGIDPYRYNPKEPSLERILTVNNCGTATGGAALSTMARLTAWGKPVVLMEWGCTQTGVTQADKAKWIGDAYSWMTRWNASASVPIESAIYFNNNLDVASNPKATWELSGDPLAVFKANCVSSRA